MQRLSDSDLSRPPSDVFEILCQLGKGSYGSVYKARYKGTGGIVAVKKVPVDSDLTDIVKEISIMQQCDSPFIVKCYGSLFDSQDLWICMEYCGAGSIADIMRWRGKTLNENEIATVLHYSLRGLDYLHQMRKIHRDIKAGNILLLDSGAAKLADFGVAGQLSDTLAKRNTVIGTPYWMAPEVIQEIGYNYSADIWSLGITAIEMADGKPPLADIHPMRALFMIPSQPSPALRKTSPWSQDFRSFVQDCLAKTPESRPTAASLLQTEFIRNSQPSSILLPLIKEADETRQKRLNESKASLIQSNKNEGSGGGAGEPDSPHPDGTDSTIVHPKSHDNASLNPSAYNSSTLISNVSGDPIHPYNTDDADELLDDMGTMVINASDEDEDVDEEEDDDGDDEAGYVGSMLINELTNGEEEGERREAFAMLDAVTDGSTLTRGVGAAPSSGLPPPSAPMAQRPFAPFSRVLQSSGLFPGSGEPGAALNNLSYAELQQLLTTLTTDLETELKNLAIRYKHKRQPLLDAIAEKTAASGVATAQSTTTGSGTGTATAAGHAG